jgi:hypothetical protein
MPLKEGLGESLKMDENAIGKVFLKWMKIKKVGQWMNLKKFTSP